MPGLLALVAHPDDEFFCAGLLAAVARRGVPIHLAWWTRGEGGGSTARRAMWRLVPGPWRQRVWEAHRSGKVLGAQSATFLGAIDPAPDATGFRAPEETPDVLAKKIAAQLDRLAPELLLTHGIDGEYGHPAHRRLSEAVCAFGNRAPVATFAATCPDVPATRFWNRSDPADFVFDSQPFAETKAGVVRAHRSQMSGLVALADSTPPTLDRLLEVSRYEGYRGHGARGPEAIELLRRWTTGAERAV